MERRIGWRYRFWRVTGSIRAIARATGWSRNAVRRYLRVGQEASVRKASAKRVEKLDPFKDYIRERLAAAAPDATPAVVLFREQGVITHTA